MRLMWFSLLMKASLAFAAAKVPTVLTGHDLVTGATIERPLAASTQPTVVVFLSSRCPCSKSHERELISLAAKYPGVSFVGVHSNVDESASQAAAFFKDQELNFPIIQDDDAKLANAFGALKTPHAYVVAVGGQEILYQGGVSDAHELDKAKNFYLRKALEAITKGQKPDPSEVRILGCYIKRTP